MSTRLILLAVVVLSLSLLACSLPAFAVVAPQAKPEPPLPANYLLLHQVEDVVWIETPNNTQINHDLETLRAWARQRGRTTYLYVCMALTPPYAASLGMREANGMDLCNMVVVSPSSE